MNEGHHYLKDCDSKPKTLADLEVGDTFIVFPYDGDDSGHGGFRAGANLFRKIEPYRPDNPLYHESVLFTCCRANDSTVEMQIPLTTPVLGVNMAPPNRHCVVVGHAKDGYLLVYSRGKLVPFEELNGKLARITRAEKTGMSLTLIKE